MKRHHELVSDGTGSAAIESLAGSVLRKYCQIGFADQGSKGNAEHEVRKRNNRTKPEVATKVKITSAPWTAFHLLALEAQVRRTGVRSKTTD